MGDATTTLILTNDDGFDAPGLHALVSAAEPFGVGWVVAPDGPRSSCGHAVTTGKTIRVESHAARRFIVHGTPADCVRLALHHLTPRPGWVLSGINAGGNLGVDIHHSGTVAAVREAVLHGVPGIALSHYIARGRPIDWQTAARRASRVLRELLARPWSPGTFWNVNLPHPAPGIREPEIVYCRVDPSPLPLRFAVEESAALYSGDYHARARVPSADVDVCFSGDIAVSCVRLVPEDETRPAE